MSKEFFYFKNFKVSHSQSSMKVGTDSVLLGAIVGQSQFMRGGDIESVLDVGCGCGVLSMMMADRFPNAKITAIDIDKPSVEEADYNFSTSQWSDRMSAKLISVQKFAVENINNVLDNQCFGLIISNPPFFENSLQSSSAVKTNARHTTSLPISDLATSADVLLARDGFFCCILPVSTAESLKIEFIDKKIFCIEEVRIFSKQSSLEPVRSVLFFSRNLTCKQLSDRCIYDDDGGYSAWYRELVTGVLVE